MNRITREGSEIGRTDDQIEMEKVARSIPSSNGKAVSPQELIALMGQRDNPQAGISGQQVMASSNQVIGEDQMADQPEVSFGVDRVSQLVEKAKNRLATASRVEGTNVMAAQEKMRYKPDEDPGRKYDDGEATKDKYYDDYPKGRDYLKKLKANFQLKLKKISKLLNIIEDGNFNNKNFIKSAVQMVGDGEYFSRHMYIELLKRIKKENPSLDQEEVYEKAREKIEELNPIWDELLKRKDLYEEEMREDAKEKYKFKRLPFFYFRQEAEMKALREMVRDGLISPDDVYLFISYDFPTQKLNEIKSGMSDTPPEPQQPSGQDVSARLKVLGAKIRRAIKTANSVEEDVRMKKVKYPAEKDLGRDYDAKDAKDRYVGDSVNPLNKSLEKMWSLNKNIKTARDKDMTIEMPKEKDMGGNDMEKLPEDKKENLPADAPKKGEPVDEKAIKELNDVIKSLEKADEDFGEEIKKIENAIETLEDDKDDKDGKSKKKDKKEDKKGKDKDEGEIGEMGAPKMEPKPKPDMKDVVEIDMKEEKPLGKAPTAPPKAMMYAKDKDGKKVTAMADYLDDFINNLLRESGSKLSLDDVKSQINVSNDTPIVEQMNQAKEVIESGALPGGAPAVKVEEVEMSDDGSAEPVVEVDEEVEPLMASFVRMPTKLASYWEVKDNNGEIIIKASCSDIYGKETFKNWDWVASEKYGRTLCARVRQDGPVKVARVLGTNANMTKIAEKIEKQAKGGGKKPALQKKLDTNKYYNELYPKDFANKMTKKYKKASAEKMKKLSSLEQELQQKEKENELLKNKLACTEKEKEKEMKEKEKKDKEKKAMEEERTLRIRANKAIALANQMVQKKIIVADKREDTIDRLMLLDDLSFSMEEELTNNKESVADAIAKNQNGNIISRRGGLNTGINIVASSDAKGTVKDELESIWNTPKVAHENN